MLASWQKHGLAAAIWVVRWFVVIDGSRSALAVALSIDSTGNAKDLHVFHLLSYDVLLFRLSHPVNFQPHSIATLLFLHGASMIPLNMCQHVCIHM